MERNFKKIVTSMWYVAIGCIATDIIRDTKIGKEFISGFKTGVKKVKEMTKKEEA